MKNICLLFMLLLTILNSAYTQNDIRGKVLDEEGSALKGVTIKTVRTGKIYQTDQHGEFIVSNILYEDSLLFKNLGFQDLHLSAKSFMQYREVRMKQERLNIEEVEVVTGYFHVPKERAVGSFETIAAEKLNNIVSTNILDRLEGQTTMLFDRGTDRPSMTLRGINTFEGNTEPLIILDNFPYEGNIETINPRDVASITFLKDASAASIWGARASNGVIIVATKSGAKSKRKSLSFSSTIQTSKKPDLFYTTQIDSKNLIDLEREMFEKGLFSSYENNFQKSFLSPVIELLIQNRDGAISSETLDDHLSQLAEIDNRKQYLDLMYRNSLAQNYHLSMSDKKENSFYYLAIGADNNISDLKSHFQRYTLQSRYGYDIGSKVAITVGLQLNKIKTKNGEVGYPTQDYYNRPYMNLMDVNGQETPHYKLLKSYAEETYEDGDLLDWALYPLREKDADKSSTKDYGVVFSSELKWAVSKDLRLDALYRFEENRVNSLQLRSTGSYYTRNLINTYTTFNNNQPVLNIPFGDVRINGDVLSTSHHLRGQLNYNKEWRKHSLSGLIGMEGRKRTTESEQHGFYGYDESNLSIASVNYKEYIPHLLFGITQTIPDYGSLRGTRNNFISTYFNLGYSYDNRYLFSGSARRDASNNLGVATNQRWNPMYSVGAGWNLHNESFWNNNIFSSLKLRTTYGLTGNIDPSKSAIVVMSYVGTDNLSLMPRATINSHADREVKWETTKMWNSGVDFTFIGGKLAGSLEYYKKWNENLFAPAINDVSNGAGAFIVRNVGNMKSEGIDGSLKIDWFIKPDFDFSTSFNYSYNRHTVTSYYQQIDRQSRNNINNGTYLYRVREGGYLYPVTSYPFVKLDSEGEMVTSIFGEETKDYKAVRDADLNNLVYSGSAIPLHFGNITLNSRYKRFHVNAIITWKVKYFFRRNSVSYASMLRQDVLSEGTADYAKRWQKPGDESYTTVPRFQYPVSGSDALYLLSSATVEPGDHIRLQNVNVGYTLPLSIGAKSYPLDISANLSNMGILWKKTRSTLDPDFRNDIPNPKSYALNLQLNF